MGITVKIDFAPVLRKLEVAANQLEYAAALALTKTAVAVKTDLQAAMRSAFVNPRRYTLNSLAVERATKQNLKARIYVRSPSVERALIPEIRGGVRDRAIEKILSAVLPPGMFAVPTSSAPRGADGKVTISWLTKLLAKLGITGNVSSTRRRRARPTSLQYFVIPNAQGGLHPGIYSRAGRKPTLLIAFTRQPTYGAKLDWFGIARTSVRKSFPVEFRKAAAVAMATAR